MVQDELLAVDKAMVHDSNSDWMLHSTWRSDFSFPTTIYVVRIDIQVEIEAASPKLPGDVTANLIPEIDDK
jgi:hypothetical protein